MRVIYECVAGLDVHKKTVVATRMRLTADKRIVWETETFGTMTPDLLKLHDWLQEWPISHVAMESTGDYWKPVYNLLEDDFAVWVVNAQHVKRVPGRKTDVTDAEWLAELMLHGLLKASFVPEKPQRGLRELTRSRVRLIEERSRIVNRVQKLLEGANIKLSSVVTDVQGVSARAMLAELAKGNTNASAMAELARGRLRNKLPELEKALTGIVESHHRFILNQHLAHVDFLDEQIAALEAEIERCIRDMGAPPAPPSTGEGTGDPEAPAEAPSEGTWEQSVILLDSIPGIDRNAAEAILAEIGTDMTRFPTPGHLCRWGGVAPGNNESGGKRHSGRTPKGNRALTRILVQCAHAAVRTKGSFFKARYHRLAGRRGKKRAIMAIAHSMLIAVWHMLMTGSFYDDLGEGYYDERHKERKIAYHTRQLEKLLEGVVQVVPSPAMT